MGDTTPTTVPGRAAIRRSGPSDRRIRYAGRRKRLELPFTIGRHRRSRSASSIAVIAHPLRRDHARTPTSPAPRVPQRLRAPSAA
ncbi:MAG: hypothetical protein M0C28_18830 [Candidatus Moduliflexus flocculans]|nr:hypothetical protein [Candidatus Moduliflexus flocculans]